MTTDRPQIRRPPPDRHDQPSADTGGSAAGPAAPAHGRGGAAARVAPVALLILGADGLVIAYRMAQHSQGHGHFAAFWASFALLIAGAMALGMRATSDAQRVGALVTYGVVTFLPKMLMTRSGPRYFDEYGHWRHANDIVRAGHVLVPTPYLAIERSYPGLEALTAALHAVTRIGTWPLGQLIVLAAHCAVLVVVWWAARLVGVSSKAAVVAAMVYSLNSSYLYFDSQYSYESLGLPLCLLAVTLVLAARRAGTGRRAWQLATAGAAVSVACTTVHHISAAVMAVLLLVVAAAVPVSPGAASFRSARRAPWMAFAVGAGFLALWLLTVARPTVAYLEPHLRGGATDTLNLLRGRSTKTVSPGLELSTRHQLFAGSHLPLYEIVCAFLAPPIALAGVMVAFLWHRRDRRQLVTWLRLLSPFVALCALYFLSMPLTLSAKGGETAHRAWGFGYAGVAVVVATAEPWWRRVRRLRPSVPWVAIGAAALAVAAVGNTAAGENVYYRFPGPDAFGTDTRSRTPELDALAAWMDHELPVGAKVVTDRFTGEAVIGYTRLVVPGTAEYPAYLLFRYGGSPAPALRDYLRQHRFEYFVVDHRLETMKPVQRPFIGYVGPQSLSPDALRAAGSTSFLTAVHTTKTYTVFRINP